MNPNELRKGNYVQDIVSSEWLIVDEIGENIGAVVINRDKYPLPDGWQMGPIPLTESVLQKFGFKLSEHKNIILYLGKTPWKIVYYKGAIQLEREGEGDGNGCFMDHITTIHRLQNLFFDLTDTELLPTE